MSDLRSQYEIMAQWRDDPVQFVREVFGVEPQAWQAEGLELIAANKRVGFSACKGPGKSTVLSWATWWLTATHIDSQTVVMSITKPNLKDNLWKELAKWYAKSDTLKKAFELGSERIVSRDPEYTKTWWISARAFAQQADADAQANTLAGLHNDDVMIVLDEMGDYPDGVVIAAEGIFANAVNARIVAAWNPTRTEGPAYRVCTKDRERWEIVNITGDPEDTNRSPLIDLVWAQQMIDDWGRDNDWVRVNVLGLFPHQSPDKLVPLEDVTKAKGRAAKPMHYESSPVVWGIDPAYMGDDASALCRRQGIVCFRFNQWRGLNGPQLGGEIARMIIESERVGWGPDIIFVDRGGVGASCYDHLELLGYENLMIGVDFGGKAMDDRFHDKRSEIWWLMAGWLHDQPANLPTDPQLDSELTAPKFAYTIRGKRTAFALETKQQLRARGIKSPNKGDALALTFAGPVNKRSKKTIEQEQARHSCVVEQDPYSSGSQPTVITQQDPLQLN